MIKKRILLYTLLIILGLSYSRFVKFTPTHNDTSSKLRPFVEKFQKEVKFIPNINIGLIDIDSKYNGYNIVGLCTLSLFPFEPEIDIDKKYFDSVSYIQKMALVYHEIGHCYCTLWHTEESYKEDGCPKSLMYPSTLVYQCLVVHWEDYIADLKRGCE